MSDNRLGVKISRLLREGTPRKQAIATAMSMKRAGRITSTGGYRRVGRRTGR